MNTLRKSELFAIRIGRWSIMAKRKNINIKKWIKNTALLFYQIFSADYEGKSFINKILSGGGGNSTLCSTWTHLADNFITHRISENAYNLLINKLDDEDKSKVRLENDTVFISKYIYKKYHTLFFNNAKGAKNRINAGKFFHFDHNPSNKKVLKLLYTRIKSSRKEDGFLEKLTEYVGSVQKLDLITVEEDDIRTSADRKSLLSLKERDNLLNTKFYSLIEE